LSIGLGQFLFPQKVSTVLANQTILYTIIVAVIVIVLLALRRKLDKRTGIFFIILYFVSYSFLFV